MTRSDPFLPARGAQSAGAGSGTAASRHPPGRGSAIRWNVHGAAGAGHAAAHLALRAGRAELDHAVGVHPGAARAQDIAGRSGPTSRCRRARRRPAGARAAGPPTPPGGVVVPATSPGRSRTCARPGWRRCRRAERADGERVRAVGEAGELHRRAAGAEAGAVEAALERGAGDVGGEARRRRRARDAEVGDRGLRHRRDRRIAVGRGVGAGGRVERDVVGAADGPGGGGDRRPGALDARERARRSLDREHRLQAVGSGAGLDGELQHVAAEPEAGEDGHVAAVQPGQHLLRRDDRDAAGLGGGDDRVRAGVLRRVGVHVRREDAVVALRPERAVEQRLDVLRVVDPDSSVICVAAW